MSLVERPIDEAGILEESEDIQPHMRELDKTLVKPYKIALGGIIEESAASSASVFAVVPLMLIFMVVVLMVALGSFMRVAIVLTLLPLGLVGVVLALLIGSRPLGPVAILGILYLLGMIAKNAVILISQIEVDRGRGLPVRDAVLEASASRFRPLVLTAHQRCSASFRSRRPYFGARWRSLSWEACSWRQC